MTEGTHPIPCGDPNPIGAEAGAPTANRGDVDDMLTYCVKIAPHYSGMISAHLPDFPGLVVLGRDHDEAKDLALAALEQELERLAREERNFPRPMARGRLTVSTSRFAG